MNLPIALIGGVLLGVLAAFGIAVVPGSLLEDVVVASGIASVFPAAEPPLGMTARAALAVAAGGFTGLFSWFSLLVLLGSRGLTVGKRRSRTPFADVPIVPTIRRADAHPDAPPRPPLLATRDLGRPFDDAPQPEPLFTPMGAATPDLEPIFEVSHVPDLEPELIDMTEIAPVMQDLDFSPAETIVFEPAPEPEAEPQPETAPVSVAKPTPVERPLPRDLDQPLSAFDPGAVLDKPLPAAPALPPLRRPAEPPVFAAGERFEVFELTPPVRTITPMRPVPVAPLRPVSMMSPPRPKPALAPVRPAAEPITRPETDASIHALLDRLERGVLRKGLAERVETSVPERGLEDALVTLRNLARRA